MEPFVRTKDKVAIVGFAENTRDFTPWEDPDYEIWSLNEGHNPLIFPFIKRWDRWFQLHPRWDYSRDSNGNDPNHFYWLQNKQAVCNKCKGSKQLIKLNAPKEAPIPCPDCNATGVYTPPDNRAMAQVIYLQEAEDDIPGSVTYPLKEVSEFLYPHLKGYKYFTSSFAYMLGLAAYMGFKQIDCYGFEMGSQTEYHYQRANAEYLIGLLHGRGVDVRLPKNTTMLKGKLYGYENMKTGYRHMLEMRKIILFNQLSEAEHKQADYEGRLKGLQMVEQTPENIKQTEVTYSEYLKVMSSVNMVKGAINETTNIIDMYDRYFVADNEGEEKEVKDTKAIDAEMEKEYVQAKIV